MHVLCPRITFYSIVCNKNLLHMKLIECAEDSMIYFGISYLCDFELIEVANYLIMYFKLMKSLHLLSNTQFAESDVALGDFCSRYGISLLLTSAIIFLLMSLYKIIMFNVNLFQYCIFKHIFCFVSFAYEKFVSSVIFYIHVSLKNIFLKHHGIY